jgi:eukaryotic-like serine/threonine-protein kinase
MAPEEWAQAKALFQACLELREDERQSRLADPAVGPELRAEVLRLLELHECPTRDGFLASPLGDRPGTQSGIDPLIGQLVGEFRIEERIGAGGNGTVYAASQSHPSRKAAVKIIGPGNQSARSLRRFEHEAELLARFQHPGLAPVFASGTLETPDGPRPWFAMELIVGQPLHRYLRDEPGSIEGRLRLLLAICDAVQYAHHRGVIHRDLKPANILIVRPVTPSGIDAPQPRVVDFGVARLLEESPQRTLVTEAGELFGTIAYMSPEQFRGEPQAVDIQSDVYALGVIGFEMLTGQLPHDRESQTLMTVLRAIDSEVPRTLGVVSPELRGDLDVILAKALAPDRSQRYASVNDFAADLQRYLNHETIKARPATAWYRCRKFVRRNRLLVGAVTTTTAALVTGLLLYAGEARRANRAADEARYEANKASAINNFVTNDFLMQPVAELVEKAAAQVPAIFNGRPLEEAAVRNEIGSIHYNLGAWDRAAAEFREALRLWESGLGPDHADTLKAVNNLGLTLKILGQNAEAEPLIRRALAGRRKVLGDEHPATLVSLNNLSQLLQSTGRDAEAESLLREAVEVQTRTLGRGNRNTLTSLANLGSLLASQGQKEAALAIHREVHQEATRVYGPDHVFPLNAGIRLANSLLRNDQAAEAKSLLVPVVAGLNRTLGDSHGDTITARRLLARIHKALGETEAAIAALNLALAGAEAASPANPAQVKKICDELEAVVSQ